MKAIKMPAFDVLIIILPFVHWLLTFTPPRSALSTLPPAMSALRDAYFILFVSRLNTRH